MSKELTKEQFLERLRTRENGKYKFLYQVGVLATANENYVRYAYDYIINRETEEIDGKLQLKGIHSISRKYPYKYEHSETAKSGSCRGEEWFVLDAYKNREKDYVKAVFGEILDYQVPLKGSKKDLGVGKIDFLFEKNSEIEKNRAIYIAEIKADYSNESAMKAIVEVQTYYQIVDKVKLLSDYEKAPDMKIKKAIVLFDNTKAALQIQENPYVRDLLQKFDIEPIILVSHVAFDRMS